MEDRIPTPGQEGRVLITPEDGSAPFYAKVEMADNPTQAGTPLIKETLLQDSTEIEIFGNAGNRTVDEAFSGVMARLSLVMQNVATITLTVTDTAENPIPNVYVNGVFDEDGESVATNASGQAVGYVADGTTTLSISNYADIINYSEQFDAVKGQDYTHTIQVQTQNFLKFTSTQNVRFSGNVEQVDVTSVGGGGGAGATNGNGRASAASGGAGGGGNCVVQEDVTFSPNIVYQAIVGAGGVAGGGGGTSSFLGVSANGGNPGGNGNISYPYIAGIGGSGNGKGGNGVAITIYPGEQKSGNPGVSGNVQGYASFTETIAYGGGGGSGGIFGGTGGSGAGYGGDGGGWPSSINGQNGTDGFGGGGGSGGYQYTEYDTGGDDTEIGSPGRGGSGCIAIRMHLKSAA